MRKVADCSFVHFVYPFLFDAAQFDQRVKRLEEVTCQSGTKANEDVPMWVPLWKEKGFPRDDMLAYVAGYLNPKDPEQATARVWKLNDRLHESFGLAGRADWELYKKERKKERAIPFRFGELGSGSFAVQLAFFRTGVGFLTVSVRPVSDDVDEWLNFISNFRFVNGQRQFAVRATKRAKNEASGEIEHHEFFPSIASDPGAGPAASESAIPLTNDLRPHTAGDAIRDNHQRQFIQVLDGMLRSANVRADEKPWWVDVFIPEQMVPFAVVYVDGAGESIEPGSSIAGNVAKAAPVELDRTDERRREDYHLIYMLRNFFNSSQGGSPAPEDLAADHPSLVPYAARCWFLFSLDGGAFLACDAPQTDFFRKTMPDHLRDQYFLLLLIVMHQRFTLMSISNDVVKKWLIEKDDEKRAEAFAQIRDRLLGFTAHGLFSQVMQREHHHRSYRKWQQVFQIQDLYHEVRDEVREMHDYLQTRRAERIKELAEARQRQMKKQAEAAQERGARLEWIIGLLGICFGVPALVMGFLNINIPGITTNDEGLKLWLAFVVVLAASVIVVGGILLMMRRYINRATKQKGDQQNGDGE